jgi:hypothetical protein
MEGHEMQPGERPEAPRGEESSGDAPRTDLPPTREPYYEGYFGTGDEEEKIRGEQEIEEVDVPDDPAEKRTPKGEQL